VVTSIEQLNLNSTYTYADYLSWKFSESVELLRGKLVKMAAPSRKHQLISRRLFTPISQHLWRQPCEVYHAPLDVRLVWEDSTTRQMITSVVQPDICVICDPNKLDDAGCNGAPDLIIEILSPGNTKKEMKTKYAIYEAAGVLEYWLVNLADKNLLQYRLGADGKFFTTQPLTDEDFIQTPILPNLVISLEDVFGHL
jgi:Uma2 family endonuclease